jgi:hypothetical protein
VRSSSTGMGILHRLISFSQPHARVRLTIAVNVTVARDCGAEIGFFFIELLLSPALEHGRLIILARQ